MGIPEADLSKLFSIETKYSGIGTEGERGTGLGLLLCKEFVEKNRGHIEVESQEGRGSTFTFTLPQSQSKKQPKGRLNNNFPFSE